MKVLVTGAAGRVGANVVKRLTRAGVDVRAMVLPDDPQKAKLSALQDVEVVEADLGDQASVDVACRSVTHVVHLAAQLVRGGTPVDRFYDVNAFGTLRLLEGALRCGAGLERFVLASTDGTYRPGDPPAVPLREDTPQEPADYYGTSKLLGEIILRNHAAQFDVPFSMVRFATVLSPEEAPNVFRVPFMRSLLRRAELGKDSNIWQLFRGRSNLVRLLEDAVGEMPDDTAISVVGPTGASWTLHLLDVRDAVEGVWLALTEAGALGHVFNIAAAAPTSFDEGAAVVSQCYDVPTCIVKMPMDWHLELAIDTAREVLGYAPRFDYRAMVKTASVAIVGDEEDFIPARVDTTPG